MEFRLHGRRGNLQDLDVGAGVGELIAEAEGEAIEGRFRGGVGRHVPGWDDGEVGTGACEAGALA